MDFHPGGDLMMLLDRFDGILDEKTSRFYLAEIALALHDLHNMGYVHRLDNAAGPHWAYAVCVRYMQTLIDRVS